jgi:hypothetical protein
MNEDHPSKMMCPTIGSHLGQRFGGGAGKRFCVGMPLVIADCARCSVPRFGRSAFQTVTLTYARHRAQTKSRARSGISANLRSDTFLKIRPTWMLLMPYGQLKDTLRCCCSSRGDASLLPFWL